MKTALIFAFSIVLSQDIVDFIKEVEDSESILNDMGDLTGIDLTELDISEITNEITNEIKSGESNSIDEIMNSAIENIMSNIAESNNAGVTTQVPTESTNFRTFLKT